MIVLVKPMVDCKVEFERSWQTYYYSRSFLSDVSQCINQVGIRVLCPGKQYQASSNLSVTNANHVVGTLWA